MDQSIWDQYVYERKTICQLAEKYKKGKDWIREHIGNVPSIEQRYVPQPIVAIADVTFFKRAFGVCVIRAPHLKKNLYAQEVQAESVDVYRRGELI